MGNDFDDRLQERLRAFQNKQGIPATGTANQQTWSALLGIPAGYGGNTRQGNYWHDEDTLARRPRPRRTANSSP